MSAAAHHRDPLVRYAPRAAVPIAGPCVIETPTHPHRVAARVKAITDALGIAYVFKASYDKANRSSRGRTAGRGSSGPRFLATVRERQRRARADGRPRGGAGRAAAAVADCLQIPAFLCRQTDLLLAAAATGKPVNIKKGQFMAPWDMKAVLEKAAATGNDHPADRARLQLRLQQPGRRHALVPGAALVRLPVVFDATHSVQQPGGLGDRSGGDAQFIDTLAPAAVAAGVDGLFMEVHENPAGPCRTARTPTA